MTSEHIALPLKPGSWLGVVGGGQLGRMFCQAAQSLGYQVAVLDPANSGPAASVADRHICGAYDDREALDQLASLCAAVSTEFENVPADSFRYLAQRTRVSPPASAIAFAQDRIDEKAFLAEQAGVRVAPYIPVRSAADLQAAGAHLFPGVLKAARLGYDGKGQAVVRTPEEALSAWQNELQQVPCVLEAFLPLAYEVSVVLGRSSTGQIHAFTPARNEHRNGILAVSVAAPGVSETETAVHRQAIDVASAIAQALHYEGVLCVEFFVLDDGSLIVNEMAPRPHNSGHYTMDACLVSQFELQARLMAGLPHGSLDVLFPVVMLNLLGDIWFDEAGARREPDWSAVLAVPGTQLHLYGKADARRERKMGHMNIVGATVAEAHQRAQQVTAILGIAPPL